MASAPSVFNDSLPAQEARSWRVLTLLALAELLGLSLWFSGSAVVPALTKQWQLTEAQVSWISIAVQLGFVVGTLISAVFNLSDIISARHLFAVAGVIVPVIAPRFCPNADAEISKTAATIVNRATAFGLRPIIRRKLIDIDL